MKDKEFTSLEMYQGELDGHYTTRWIATANRDKNFYMTSDLQLIQSSRGINLPDFASTKWTQISNEQHYKITEDMYKTYRVKYPTQDEINILSGYTKVSTVEIIDPPYSAKHETIEVYQKPEQATNSFATLNTTHDPERREFASLILKYHDTDKQVTDQISTYFNLPDMTILVDRKKIASKDELANHLKGQLEEIHNQVWIATHPNDKNYYMNANPELQALNTNPSPESKWVPLSNEDYSKIHDEIMLAGYLKQAHEKIDPKNIDELLDGYKKIARVTIHNDNAPAGSTLEEVKEIYKKDDHYAIKTELYDVDSYGVPGATYFEKNMDLSDVFTKLDDFDDHSKTIYLDDGRMNQFIDLVGYLNQRERTETPIELSKDYQLISEGWSYAGDQNEYIEIYQNKNQYAIKTSISDPGDDGLPQATHLKKDITFNDVLKSLNDFDDQEKQFFLDHIPINTLSELKLHLNKKVMPTKDEKEVEITGYLGKDKETKQINYNYKFFEDTKKSAINGSIKPAGKDTEWVQFKAWNTLAERIREGIQTEGIDKLTLVGKFKEVSFEGQNGPKTIQELQVSQLQKHKIMEITGNIVKLEEKTTKNDKAYTSMVILNETVAEGKGKKDFYEVTMWSEKKKAMPKDLTLKTGMAVAIKGEATILENEAGTEKYTKVTAWNIDKNLKSLHAQIKQKQAEKIDKDKGADKTTDKGKAAAKPKGKAKDKGIGM